ncbi:ATP phosphoribosyltransferase regulatory subunit [Caballeronia sordidicola]|uniref:ATP phosphoribosyltransferase regulatory subunit n=1 Tax=Caballeronia sordidicola TaxID=196367 RepID=A0A158IF89_CABSO|nr:ATP phosphoribosyltransferase regulatory subunit [Caballeronia sordidicola]
MLTLESTQLTGFEFLQVTLNWMHYAASTTCVSTSGVLAALLDLEPAAVALGDPLLEVLGAKDVPRLNKLTGKLSAMPRDVLRALPSLYGDTSVLAEAQRRLPKVPLIGLALG